MSINRFETVTDVVEFPTRKQYEWFYLIKDGIAFCEENGLKVCTQNIVAHVTKRMGGDKYKLERQILYYRSLFRQY